MNNWKKWRGVLSFLLTVETLETLRNEKMSLVVSEMLKTSKRNEPGVKETLKRIRKIIENLIIDKVIRWI